MLKHLNTILHLFFVMHQTLRKNDPR